MAISFWFFLAGAILIGTYFGIRRHRKNVERYKAELREKNKERKKRRRK